MVAISNQPPHRILIASANPLFSKGLQKLFAERWPVDAPEMRLSSSMGEILQALESWQPELVVLDYDDRAIQRAEFLNHFVEGVRPMQVMLVSLQASGDVTVYDRRTLTPDQARDWLGRQVPLRRASFWSPGWIVATLLVLVALAVFIRLGVWQLDRLAQRRTLNAHMQAQMALPALDLNAGLPTDWAAQEYRSVVIRGVYDPAGEVVLQNQAWNGQPGARVLTPLKIDGLNAMILVDRGWIPLADMAPASRAHYAEPGPVTVTGMLRLSAPRPTFVAPSPTLAPGQSRLDAFNFIDLPAIQRQVGSQLLPVLVLESPDPAWTGLPHRLPPVIDVSEGPHLGYALQWFLFAVILGVGYPFYVRSRLRQARPGNTEPEFSKEGQVD